MQNLPFVALFYKPKTMKETLLALFDRDLEKLKTEILSYNDTNALWRIDQQISNSGGNLCLHLMGNLNHFIGALLGNSGYVRERELEFTQKNIPIPTLIQGIEDTKIVVQYTLSTLSDADFARDFPFALFKQNNTTTYVLWHLLTHLNYHLGQINYHRRILDTIK